MNSSVWFSELWPPPDWPPPHFNKTLDFSCLAFLPLCRCRLQPPQASSASSVSGESRKLIYFSLFDSTAMPLPSSALQPPQPSSAPSPTNLGFDAPQWMICR
ncbi:hypothetical protein E3N88_34813 [Mikania micrantha]|uniref:Uncharacterized protein n=1 Tax=Mikania micrantha TaxID=192012 RepID=A0A5N6M1V4_9ASTR|nr:hypothetical protein E3N88_34813 [Mikania micrantha]